MTNLTSSMRLKVKRDTFFLPDPEGSVYFRNNVGSFHMEGSMIDQWVEQLLPMFNGEHTLEELTDGLPDEYRDQVFDIAQSLFQNGFVQDVSQDRPHHLPEKVLDQYGPQIEFLSNLADSGAYRFMGYRQSKVVAVGSGPFFVSLVASLLDSGLPKFHMLITDAAPTNRQRIEELAAYARKMDPEVAIEELAIPQKNASFWREAVQPFDAILYVSQTGDIEELRLLQTICKEENKLFLPAVMLEQVGLAGPLVDPSSEGCWESAWRRIHQTALGKERQVQPFSATAAAMLANVIVFEWFKAVTAVTESELRNQVFLLNGETLEGSWHSFTPHPSVTGQTQGKWIEDFEQQLDLTATKQEASGLISYFSTLTSATTGIFHRWDEEDLIQLPLAQCLIQVPDPLSEGPAKLLPEMVCSGLTHEEARKEAGLAGIESYVARMAGGVGVGAGETVAESICRALQQCLSEELSKQLQDEEPAVTPIVLSQVEDQRCQYYVQALTAMQEAPKVGLGANVLGFPVVWVGTNECWYGSVGLNVTLALRKSLQRALLQKQNQTEYFTPQVEQAFTVQVRENEQQSLVISAFEEEGHPELLESSLQVLKQNGMRLVLCDLALESFLKEELAGVFGALLREEESR
ncbi:putative thiazole-containing bacteriocin maturation protein [Brevibacillus choshinensis]|uniref:putative thiazole-containing bacteriocin maturation protein n=1 Tax=Brevibacillus choshinensis TaxID=54911 RepID=UPI002E21F67C|nr:putative thiazole-containing bacteriocin maturation protein [Brevibacillus choshinensis]MED4779580.1 putative thiazole-containing bacteriocin maturation protein [Brevibacillus choshinensis]